jgi:hypothetical protein
MMDLAKMNPEGDELTPEVIKQNIKLPANLQEAYDRVVLAGKKIIFNKDTNKLVLDAIKGEGSLGIRLGKGISTLMMLLYRESQQTMPPSLIVPAGVCLLGEAADFIRKGKIEPINNNIIAEAIQVFIEATIQNFGGDTNRMYSLFDQFEKEQQQQTQQTQNPGTQGGMA